MTEPNTCGNCYWFQSVPGALALAGYTTCANEKRRKRAEEENDERLLRYSASKGWTIFDRMVFSFDVASSDPACEYWREIAA